jgi:hypothetical protein
MEARMIMAWITARLVPIVSGAALVAALFAWDFVRMNRAETRGDDRAIVRVEKNNAKVRSIGAAGARSYGVPVPGSVRDPRYRVEN